MNVHAHVFSFVCVPAKPLTLVKPTNGKPLLARPAKASQAINGRGLFAGVAASGGSRPDFGWRGDGIFV